MKQCKSCGQVLSEKILTCPACGSQIVEGIKYIDDYKILAIIHEGRSSIVCKAIKDSGKTPVSIRLFTEKSGVDDSIAKRLEKELKELKKLPSEHFVQHYAVKKSNAGLWYRISEWVDAADWGSIFVSDLLNDPRRIVTLFHNIASVLDLLHKQDHFMPYLILDDILIPKKKVKSLHVKVNYKLSRFLNARATHHGPMLQKLLDCHPDIINQRPIDFKSGIWSLGKLFIELLTADHNLKDFSSKVDALKGLNPELGVLIKIMLSDDPDLRPQTMAKVVSALSHILDHLPYPNQPSPLYKKGPWLIKELKWFKKIVVFLILIIVGIITFGAISWMYVNFNKNKEEIVLSNFVESYASSVAFLMVEYWLSDAEQIIYKNRVEGTAFLVDNKGYLLTNRHVTCPWLDDTTLFQVYNQYAVLKRPVEFDHRMFLWFEGEKAFNRLPDLRGSKELSDYYFLSSAYTTNGKGNLRIVGVPRSSLKTGEMIKSPFKNDFAIIKIDTLPSHLKPLPLETAVASEDIQRLTPVIILGFPLGNRTQDDHINTSITRGHVRRTTKEIIQVDSSIYMGNSGGPAINAKGLVIGIASGVVTDQTNSYFKINTPLSDFGLILPISRPAKFIESIKTGQPHWDGLLDFSLESKLEQITSLAIENKFKAAADLCETMLKKSKDPTLVFAAGMLHFSTGNMDKSKSFFKNLSLIEQKNTTSRLMIYIIDWVTNNNIADIFTKNLFSMNWYEEDEFSGYMAKVLKNKQKMIPGFIDYESRSEKSWRLFIEGLILEKNNELEKAQKIFKQSILNAGIKDWVYYLSFSRLNNIQKQLEVFLENKQVHKKAIKAFRQKAKEYRQSAYEHSKAMTALIKQFESDKSNYEEKVQAYIKLLELEPENRMIIGRIAFFHTANSEWQKAIDFIDIYFKKPTRESALSLSLGLLKGELLKIMGKKQEALDYLKNFSKEIHAPWYGIISKHLISKVNEQALVKLSGKKPERLLILHTALGLWAEGDQDMEKASHHYREALSSYLDEWDEYDLALGRLIHFRQSSN
ncbi:MAG: trypsin-like serine protease [Desulfobacula sp.]|jgi:S1-C subfamily serine protease/RNA polymerase subunit RPABC4/transcription elongation factor Spt4/cell division septum initiation protein DivIVA|uniref:trypsin-like peptidase domain-containing protein n=1 Tax=Desulfobacula sp. TaxID=2593537 RepID=UPI001E148646|nr:trypsin-like serine protease [Desulfobacula sp.]MBT3484991.1 trypsin-like serine protease [Desulfobacula sp.]MBT3804192.1 trypsin-like serine protease [Desulfobacula sp.]MBT4025048.1 trypsin-like serine protease [Desulfobacula sp.]MBT4198642.1 trypsin-like serine protease [Desulfobacula sp.]